MFAFGGEFFPFFLTEIKSIMSSVENERYSNKSGSCHNVGKSFDSVGDGRKYENIPNHGGDDRAQPHRSDSRLQSMRHDEEKGHTSRLHFWSHESDHESLPRLHSKGHRQYPRESKLLSDQDRFHGMSESQHHSGHQGKSASSFQSSSYHVWKACNKNRWIYLTPSLRRPFKPAILFSTAERRTS